MSIEENNAVAGRSLAESWGKDFNPAIIDELTAPRHQVRVLAGRAAMRPGGARALAENLRISLPDLW